MTVKILVFDNQLKDGPFTRREHDQEKGATSDLLELSVNRFPKYYLTRPTILNQSESRWYDLIPNMTVTPFGDALNRKPDS